MVHTIKTMFHDIELSRIAGNTAGVITKSEKNVISCKVSNKSDKGFLHCKFHTYYLFSCYRCPDIESSGN